MLNNVYKASLTIPLSFSVYFYWQSVKFYLSRSERILSAWNFIVGVTLLIITSTYSIICGLGVTLANFCDNIRGKPFNALSQLDPYPVILINVPIATLTLSIWSLYGIYIILGDVNTVNYVLIKSFTINSALTQLLSITNCGIFVYYMARKSVSTSTAQQKTN
ncbi:hypothetical protein BMR1_03g00036 [Babesia microti strain RI]|uniref:Uncharacterized protein n=1 Tax=Babesia microti (strain RI) TaxID=1133968 RepID=A0A1R4AB09_BABMR|nr:hypothetical protein BMR1_03g00036 [Babesia microti strain RI]SJK86192.1 hypothetical protein BMR1_03g00036 [Babesia microti strain RI]|eukprot:XP_021338381.1 hypothetical protein BMR1_03g00036 [Babesia microti strain RI]